MSTGSSKPLILLTNDDGINAPGIQALAGALSALGTVVVVAPEIGQSGMSQALTTVTPLRVNERSAGPNPSQQFAVSGTPTDCVKIALHSVLKKRPNLVVAGINHGSNASVNVLYSGTMGATIEGCVAGIPSIGFSLVRRELDADLKPYLPWCVSIAREVIQYGLPTGICLNVNLPRESLNGVKVCRQASAKWDSEFEERCDPWGRPYFWLTGLFKSLEPPSAVDTDDYALRNGFISIVPVSVDMTAHSAIPALASRQWEPSL